MMIPPRFSDEYPGRFFSPWARICVVNLWHAGDFREDIVFI